MSEPSQRTQLLIQKYLSYHQQLQTRKEPATLAMIHVDEVASEVASFYEKIREIVEWREEQLLRKTAIERALRRRLFLVKNGNNIAEPLLYDLIRGGHFPNDSIPESKIKITQDLINKYIFILENSHPIAGDKNKSQLYNWLIGICACELEETLCPPVKEKALMEYMKESMQDSIKITNENYISETEKNTQISIAVQKTLFRLDNLLISYHLLEEKYPYWSNPSAENLKEIAENIYLTQESIEKSFNHRTASRFYRICKKYDTAYLVIGDILTQNHNEIQQTIKNPDDLRKLIEEAYEKRLKRLKAKINRAAIYATISIFITKILLVLAVEIPFDRYLTGQFNFVTLGINIAIPPLLMLFLIATIKPPTKENIHRLTLEVIRIIYSKEGKNIYEIKSPRKKSILFDTIMTALYSLTFIVSFGVIIWALEKISFSVLSIIIFLTFLCLISFAGTKIRESAKELQIDEEKETILQSLFDLLTLPVINTGKWLSERLTKYNVILILITLLIDLPFHFFVEFLEQWRYFLKEKKEEIH